jgi:meso-butanediol dehydrogenase / (S,S)-butanediol dehydrogenase / diacetyl reductase
VSRVIAITGAGLGLGRAVARLMAKEGDTLVLLGRTLSKVQALVDELGGKAMAVECDVASADSVRKAFAEIAAVHPKIDVLINNAAVYEPFTIAEATDEQLMTAIMTNYAGPLFTCRAAIPMMDRGGHIINVSSESVENNFPMLSLYQSSKAALERFTHSLVGELEPSGIRVTTFRAGPMYEEGKTSNWEPEAAMRFGKACMDAGINLMTRPISHVDSVAQLFRNAINTPADVQLNLVAVEGRKP